MDYVIADICVQYSTPVGTVVELAFKSLQKTDDTDFYASCVVGPFGEISPVNVTCNSIFPLLQEISAKIRKIEAMEDSVDDYTDEYEQLCKEVEKRKIQFVCPCSSVHLSSDTYDKISFIVNNVAESSAYHGTIVNVVMSD